MQNFVGYKVETDTKTGREKKTWTECVANNRMDAARKMKVPIQNVCLAG